MSSGAFSVVGPDARHVVTREIHVAPTFAIRRAPGPWSLFLYEMREREKEKRKCLLTLTVSGVSWRGTCFPDVHSRDVT